MFFEITYKLAEGPKPLSFVEYESELSCSFRKLLDSDPIEPDVQTFLVKNPCLVPGAWTPGSISGHYPLHCSLITRPLLPGFDARIPDFMWIATHSDSWFPTLIEIEKPSKRVFKADGVPRADFTQARNQLAQWRTWFNDPANRLKFQKDYDIPGDWIKYRGMRLHMILIYGRRREFESDSALSKQRGSLITGVDEEVMSFDRLTPDPELTDAITVRASGLGRFVAVAVSPTLTLGPILAERLLVIDGLDEAIESSASLSVERKKFLKSRLPYWREWAQRSAKGIVKGRDQE